MQLLSLLQFCHVEILLECSLHLVLGTSAGFAVRLSLVILLHLIWRVHVAYFDHYNVTGILFPRGSSTPDRKGQDGLENWFRST